MSKTKQFTNTEIGVALNNSVTHALGASGLKDMTASRNLCLRNYLAAVLDVLIQHHKDGDVTPEELVYLLSAGAMFVHVLLVTKGTDAKVEQYRAKLPQFQQMAHDMAKDIDDGRTCPEGKK